MLWAKEKWGKDNKWEKKKETIGIVYYIYISKGTYMCGMG